MRSRRCWLSCPTRARFTALARMLCAGCWEPRVWSIARHALLLFLHICSVLLCFPADLLYSAPLPNFAAAVSTFAVYLKRVHAPSSSPPALGVQVSLGDGGVLRAGTRRASISFFSPSPARAD